MMFFFYMFLQNVVVQLWMLNQVGEVGVCLFIRRGLQLYFVPFTWVM
jgi:hypothetical protein